MFSHAMLAKKGKILPFLNSCLVFVSRLLFQMFMVALIMSITIRVCQLYTTPTHQMYAPQDQHVSCLQPARGTLMQSLPPAITRHHGASVTRGHHGLADSHDAALP